MYFICAIQEKSVVPIWRKRMKWDICNCLADTVLDTRRIKAWWELCSSGISDSANNLLHYTWHQCRTKCPWCSVVLLTCTLACKIQQPPLSRQQGWSMKRASTELAPMTSAGRLLVAAERRNTDTIPCCKARSSWNALFLCLYWLFHFDAFHGTWIPNLCFFLDMQTVC